MFSGSLNRHKTRSIFLVAKPMSKESFVYLTNKAKYGIII